MDPGETFADRFELLALAGRGGMGVVYRARDAHSGELVALKVLIDARDPRTAARFVREAAVLARLRHDAIVGYVAHGQSAQGDCWLAMRWLDGEELAARLARAPLTAADAVAVATRAADALGFAHARGVIHRDLKPANLFLPGGECARATLLDFGIARADAGAAVALTGNGQALGTPGYMAPEQARGEAALSPRADVFALGCVLFECVAGRAVFRADSLFALFAKVLLEEPPRLGRVVPGIPPPLDDLVAAMLAKDPAERPADGAAVAERLRALPDLRGIAAAPSTLSLPRAPTPMSREQRLLGVVALREFTPGSESLGVIPTQADARAVAATHDASGRGAPADAEVDGTGAAIAVIARGLRARLERLRDGTALAVLAGHGSATDLAAAAARCALAFRGVAPKAGVAVAIGRGLLADSAPTGEVIERVAGLLARAVAPPRARVLIDETTAKLLGPGFETRAAGGETELAGTRATDDPGRAVRGRATPFVGRERELAGLVSALDECIEERAARAVLVVGAPGAGKSRLRHEFAREARALATPPRFWNARTDPLGAASPYGLASRLLRDAARGDDAAAPDEPRPDALAAYIGRCLPGAAGGRVAAVLTEAFSAGEPAAGLRDPRDVADRTAAAWVELVAAACERAPLVIAVEDLHWGDLPSLALLDVALGRLHDRALFVLGLARPEVHGAFPELWARRARITLDLGDLSRRAAERLVREVLGADVPAERVARLVAAAGGNPFYLEELLRAGDAADAPDAPASVLAMIQARLEAMGADARRAARAASVFGETLWSSGVNALLGDAPAAEPGAGLAELVREEVVVPRSASRFAGEEEFRFRHALARDAAYATLTEDDRVAAHGAALRWLLAAGEDDAVVLGGHAERAGAFARAAGFYLRAAEAALAGNDLRGARTQAARARSCADRRAPDDAPHELAGAALRVEAEVALQLGAPGPALAAAQAALARLHAGTDRWFLAQAARCVAASQGGDLADARAAIDALCAHEAAACNRPTWLRAIAAARSVMVTTRRTAEARALAAVMARHAEAYERDVDTALAVEAVEALQASIEGRPADDLRATRRWLAAAERAGFERQAVVARNNAAAALQSLGCYAEAEAEFRVARANAERLGLDALAAHLARNLAGVLVARGATPEARAILLGVLPGLRAGGDLRVTAATLLELSRAALRDGDAVAAERYAREAIAVVPAGATRATGEAHLAHVVLARGAVAEALALCRGALAAVPPGEALEECDILLYRTYAEALLADGDRAGGTAAARVALARLRARADAIAEPAWRASFLADVADHAATVALAAALGVDTPG